MLAKIFLLCLFITNTQSIPGHTTAGTHFVVAVHRVENNLCVIYFDTEEEYVTITVVEPVNLTSHEDEDTVTTVHRLLQDGTVKHVIKKELRFPTLGTYRSIVITSTGPTRAFVWMSATSGTESALNAFKILPKESCHRSYQVTTPIPLSFLSILTFDDSETIVQITLYTEESRIEDEDKATPKTFFLEKYRVYSLKTERYARITSNKPIQVISWSTQCLDQSTKARPGFCANTARPEVSWGKEYVVPVFIQRHTDNEFYFSAQRFPLNVKVYQDRNDSQNIKIQHPPQSFSIGNRNQMVIFKSGIPFGLEMFFTSTSYRFILPLIPVEQWRNAMNFKYPRISTGVYGMLHIVTRKIEKSEESVHGGDIPGISWTDKERMTVENVVYTYRMGYLGQGSKKVYYVQNSTETIMLYVQGFRSGKIKSVYVFPYDYYQGTIYQTGCDESDLDKVVPSDGVDDDCDGFIDEEIKNGKDDDNDGKIDEDNVETIQDGEWGLWSPGVNIMCRGMPINVRTRSCIGRLGLGKHCKGVAIDCDFGECPTSCNYVDIASVQCFSGINCQKCTKGFFVCDKCRDGYVPSRQCTTFCPPGWDGDGCVVPNFDTLDFQINNNDNQIGRRSKEGFRVPSPKIFENVYVAGAVLALAVSGVLVYGIFIEYKHSSKNLSGDEEGRKAIDVPLSFEMSDSDISDDDFLRNEDLGVGPLFDDSTSSLSESYLDIGLNVLSSSGYAARRPI